MNKFLRQRRTLLKLLVPDLILSEYLYPIGLLRYGLGSHSMKVLLGSKSLSCLALIQADDFLIFKLKVFPQGHSMGQKIRLAYKS